MRTALLMCVAAITLLAQTGWEGLAKQTDDLYLKGDLPGALETAQKSLDAATTPKQRGWSLDRVGFLLHQNGRAAEGEKPLREALELRLSLGRETADYADTAINLAMLLRDERRFPEAETLAAEGAGIRARVLGAHSPSYAEALNIEGTVYAYAGDFGKAEPVFDRAIEIHESQMDPAHPSPEYGTLCTNFAGTCQRFGKYEKARVLFGKALATLAKSPGINHPAYTTTVVASANLEQELGHYRIAEKLYGEALGPLVAQLGEWHPVVASSFNNQGLLYLNMGNLKKAEASFVRGLAIWRKVGDPVRTASSLRNYAGVVFGRDQKAGAQLFQEAVDILEKLPSPPAYEYAQCLLALGRARRIEGDLPSARKSLAHALDLVGPALGETHPIFASGLRELSLVNEAMGAYDEAERDLRRAIAIDTGAKGPDHPEQVRNLIILARLCERKGNAAEAYDLLGHALRIEERTTAQVLALGSESAKSAMLGQLDNLAPVLIEFQSHAGPLAQKARALAFEAVTNQKGLALDSMRGWQAGLREHHPKFEEWKKVVDCETALYVAVGYRDWRKPDAGVCALEGTSFAGRYDALANELRRTWTAERGKQAVEAIQDLDKRADQLEESLSREVPAFHRTKERIDLEAIRSHLMPHELLIEIISYQLSSNAEPAHYGAFALDSSGRLEWADLGKAASLDRDVRDLLEAAGDWSVNVTRHELRSAAAVEDTATQALAALSARMGDILAKRIGIRRLRIAPDGLLSLVPFEALHIGGRPLLAKYSVSYLEAGRELAEAEPPATGLTAPVIAISPGGTMSAGAPYGAFRSETLARLPGAGREAAQLQSFMPSARTLGEGEATESAVKKLTRPAVLHVIGHGVVRGKESCSPCELDSLPAAERIMNLSAIVLEEAYGRGGSGSKQDGFLTAQELRNLDLDGTGMLVISQCRMADGVPATGDGVYGMRRAVALAGVRSLVAPLWNVADDSEQALMGRFYRELKAGTDRAEALRRAKLELESRPGMGHFLNWAAPMLFGDAGPLPADLFRASRGAVARQ